MKTFIYFSILLLFSCSKELTTRKLNSSESSNSEVYHLNVVYPIDQDNWNPCTSEYVHLSGNVRAEETENVTENKINAEMTVHYDSLRGIGTSGIIYHGMGSFHVSSQAVWNAEGGYYQVKNSNQKYKAILTVPGAKNNLIFTTSFKIVYDASGRLRVEDFKFVYDSCN
ncbi:MAG TPA: hypothetical protein VN958_21795 [Chitinophagaceae bacterium]|nr:hypothetical protein [Chitinophagaceae bacterium]